MTNRQPAYRKVPISDSRSVGPRHATTWAFGKGAPLVFAAIGALLALTACGGSVNAGPGRGANRVPVDPGTQVHASGGNEPALLATNRERSEGRLARGTVVRQAADTNDWNLLASEKCNGSTAHRRLQDAGYALPGHVALGPISRQARKAPARGSEASSLTSASGAKQGLRRVDRQHRDKGAKRRVPGRRIRRRQTSGKLSTIFKKRPTASGEQRTLGGVSERSY